MVRRKVGDGDDTSEPAELVAIAKGALKRIDQNLRQAMALRAIYRPAAFDRDVVRQFDRTEAAHAFNLLREQALLGALLALARVWDPVRGASSLPRVARLLLREGVVEALVAERKAYVLSSIGFVGDPTPDDWWREDAEHQVEKAVQQVLSGVPEFLGGVERFMGSEFHQSILVMRNKRLAHSLAITDAETKAIAKGETIAPVVIGDEDHVIEVTVPLVVGLHRLLEWNHVDMASFERCWTAYGAQFWAMVGKST